jgi:pimeloyl-ACP methyl ester carboxylesterase
VLLAGATMFCTRPMAPAPSAPVALHDCVVSGVAASCGSIPEFENRATRRGRQIDIHFAVVRSTADGHRQAVFSFAGGPGQGSEEMVPLASGWMAPLLATSDLVYVDQRGTGESHVLACDPISMDNPAPTFGHVFDPSLVPRCRKTLEADADLTQYSTDDAVADVDDVRAALGYDTIGLYGVSYGTRMVQAYMRRYREHSRVAVLDGVLPADVNGPLTYAASAQSALARVFAACLRDVTCSVFTRANGAAEFDTALRRFDQGPRAATVHGDDGKAIAVTMTRGDFGYAVRGMLYQRGITASLAGLIHTAAATGNVDGFAQAYAERASRISRSLALGLHLSVLCSEDVPFASDDEIAQATASTFLGRYLFDEYRAACAEWPRAAIRPDARTPVTSRVPTMVVSGAFDPVTPPAFAERVRRSLPLAKWSVDPDGSHGSAQGCSSGLVLSVLETASLSWISDACR